jgi:hypothetical protein
VIVCSSENGDTACERYALKAACRARISAWIERRAAVSDSSWLLTTACFREAIASHSRMLRSLRTGVLIAVGTA